MCRLQEEEQAIFDAFKPFFGDDSIAKVWHNYSFDRHVMQRMVRCRPPFLLCHTSARILCLQAWPCKGKRPYT